ncbi:hypothetical protein LOZ53_000570 [Ophidiomyces ophidiicola]|nr:hypothetical protein LOZ55_001344 [Ophidiomyces ophidiicola]KAI1983456.1 hypothetical protein LOZ54_004924 [Ophidiomyces ophidiicola]KAI1997391.1 hypothetical protein LOZ53_000570 [Ophidiomyces ophidiicola]KAI1999496.1 hypothetical protein LOZ51_001984 [Ophidiomyces ophidiicola]
MVPPAQAIKKLLVANRGEIAVRILQAARELPAPVETYALYTPDDRSHCDLGGPHHALALPSPAAYMDITLLVKLVQEHSIDAVHPGYGFLSESPEFAQRMWEDAGARVIGPGWEVLSQTGDKLQAKSLASTCGVPVLRAMARPTGDINAIKAFATEVGYPVMIKAVDGGGGRGIRLVQNEDMLQKSVDRATGESPSKKVFVEKAAVDGYHHVEVQIVGDGTGAVRHLWERDCSIQRRFQKIIECAPALMKDRKLIRQVIEAALRIASQIKYLSLGTFEFLVNEKLSEFYFLEINPRLQVEHTITESITSVDLVRTQLLLAQGTSLQDIGFAQDQNPEMPPGSHSIQLRLCAEDPNANFALSIRKITEFHIPGGNGVRVDTSISTLSPVVVGSDFDNMFAKIIVTAASWDSTLSKARRVLEDTRISGIKTNIDILRAVIASADFQDWRADTRWLENNLNDIIAEGRKISQLVRSKRPVLPASSAPHILSASVANTAFRKGDAWSIDVQPLNATSSQPQLPHHLLLSRVLRNEFPSSLSAEIEYTTPASVSAPANTVPYKITISTTSTLASSLSSTHRLGDPNNSSHIVLPISGKLIEMLVSEGDQVGENAVIAFVKQMKMEIEVRSPRAGRVAWVLELESEDGDDVPEGVLLAELEGERSIVEIRGKL